MFGDFPSQKSDDFRLRTDCDEYETPSLGGCACTDVARTLQDCTQLLNKRIVEAISSEIEQFQVSVRQIEERGCQDRHNMWDALTLTSRSAPPVQSRYLDVDRLLADMMHDASQLLLAKLKGSPP